MNWLIVALVVLALIVLLRVYHFKHKILVIALVGLFLFFYVTFSIVAKSNSLSLESPSGVFQAGKMYLSWFGSAFSNLKTITTNAVNMDWKAENSTLVKKAEGIMKG